MVFCSTVLTLLHFVRTKKRIKSKMLAKKLRTVHISPSDCTPSPQSLIYLAQTESKFALTFLTDILKMHGSSTPVDALALILHKNSNFAFHLTVCSCTSSLKRQKTFRVKLEIDICVRYNTFTIA